MVKQRENFVAYDYDFKVISLGGGGIGKNTLLQAFFSNLLVSDSKMTIGVDFAIKSLKFDGKRVKLKIWVFGAEEQFKILFPTYIRRANGGILKYDITNYSSFDHIYDWLAIIREEIKTENEFPINLVGNKADLENKKKCIPQRGN